MPREQRDTALSVAYEDFVPLDIAHPEKNLLRALLVTAMADLSKDGEVGRMAREYFMNPRDDYLFSFRAVCEQLDLDAESIISKLGVRSAAE